MLKIVRAFSIVLPLVFVLMACKTEPDTVQADTLPILSDLANEAIQDLAGRLNVQSGDIVLVREVAVTWRDGSLGCPQAGMMYTQALVPGTLIVLRVGDTEYEYHSGGGRAPFYCENPVSPATAKSSAD